MAMASNSRLLRTIFILLFVVFFCPIIRAKIIHVDHDGQTNFDNIQAGIDIAVDGDMVLVAPGEYIITEPITFRGKAVTVQSEAGPDKTTIRMDTPSDTKRGSVVIFEYNETADSELDGFTITGGTGSWLNQPWSTGNGGGIAFLASSGTVKNCVILQNHVDDGGGGVMVGSGSSTTLMDCIISENTTSKESGGGVCCVFDSFVTMNNCIIAENTAGDSGGGIIAWDNSSLTMTNCIINGNSALGEAGGGALCGQDSSMTMTCCTVIGNTADKDAGGVYVGMGHSSGTVTNCIIARNTAYAWGGGGVMCSWPGSSLTINNCTIWGNSGGSRWGGGGVLCREASMTITNSIIWGNEAPIGREISVQNPASTSTVTYSSVAGGQAGASVESGCVLDWGAGNINADPLFARFGYLDDKGTRDPSDDVWVNGDYHLKSQAGRWDSESQTWFQDEVTSPCIDAGDPMSPIGWELFPNGGFVNMGAYGGTAEASKSYFGEPPCGTIVAGDINGDCQVNRIDLEIMALHWTEDEPLQLP